MKKLVLLSLSVVMISACDSKQDGNGQPHLKNDQADKKTHPVEAHNKIKKHEKGCLKPEQLIDQIYKTEFEIESASEKQLSAYFDEKLVQLILKDNRCTDEIGICNIEFDIFSYSQDPQYDMYDIAKSDVEHQYVVTLFNPSDKTYIKYQFNKTACPKISNIRYSQGDDLVHILEQ